MPRSIIKNEKAEFLNGIVSKMKHIMMDQNMTQLMLAKKLNVAQSLISRRFNDPRTIGVDDLYDMAKALKVPIEEILVGDKK